MADAVATQKAPTKPYTLKEGHHHLVRIPGDDIQVKEVKAGQTVELTAAQAKAWRDRFEPVGDGFKESEESIESDKGKDDKDKGKK